MFWKIDDYDLTLQFVSNDPSDASQTKRALTVTLSEKH
jgi:hypothetical protein